MNTTQIIKELKSRYPGKSIILNPPENPSEIICEIEPTSDHEKSSTALVVVDKSKQHYHKKSVEIYEALKGTLTIYINGEKYIINEGEKLTIEPNVIHYVEGNESWFLTYSKPGWTIEDHILVNDE
jgi:mannose-6-phosphate isomerase-like protein (cupin superfamily)